LISGGKSSPVLLLKKTSLFSSGNTRWTECGSSLNWLVDASGLEVTLGVALFFPFRDSEDNMDDVLLCFLGYYWDRFPSIALLDCWDRFPSTIVMVLALVYFAEVSSAQGVLSFFWVNKLVSQFDRFGFWVSF